MAIAEYRTQDIKQSRQLEYWNEVICKEFTQLECSISGRGAYRGELTSWNLNPIQFAQVRADPSAVHHTHWQVSKSPEELYLIHLQTEGESLNVQAGREAYLKPGDFTICSSKEPYAVRFERAIEMFVLRVPSAILHQYVVAPEGDMMAHRFSGEDFLGSLISSLLRRLWLNKISFDDSLSNTNICTSILSLLAAQLERITPGAATESSVRNAHMQRIKHYIERHLADPELSPGSIAMANALSPRYLRLLFEAEGVTCSRYVNQRRLQQVARDLANPMARHLKITEIAYRWGFNNQSHFSRAFRDQFQCSAQDYRQAQLRDGL